MASAGSDGAVRLWDADTGRELRRMPADPVNVSRVTFSPDGKTLHAVGARSLSLWEVASGKERSRVSDERAPMLWPWAVSPDGKVIASRQGGGDDNRVRLTAVASGKVLHLLEGHQAMLLGVAFSADGKLLATGSRDESIRVWDVDKGKELHKLTGHEQGAPVLAFSADARRLASGPLTVPGRP